MMSYLKSIPDEKNKITKVKLSRLPEGPGHLHLESSNGLLVSIAAEFDPNWGDLSVTVRKDLLLHLLDAGNRKIELNDTYGPIVGTYGFGMYVAMPIRPEKPQTKLEQKTEQVAVQAEQPAPESIEQKTTTNTNTTTSIKENPTMNEPTITRTVSAPVQTVAQNHEPELNPLDELAATIEAMKAKLKAMFDESTTMARKVREVALAQRQKEREYQQTKRTLNRVRMAI